MAIPQWFEAVVPLAIIATLIAGMGALPGGVHQLMLGKPKAVNPDQWDRQTASRDARVLAEAGGEATQ